MMRPMACSSSANSMGESAIERGSAQLLAAVEGGQSQVLLVTGPAGIGKSALVHDLEDMPERPWRWLAGKCDALGGNVPYAPVIEACRGLVAEILEEPEPVVASLREQLSAAVAPNGRALTKTIPELERLIGPRPALPEVGLDGAADRFHQGFAAFVRALAASGAPCVLFVDDLQWADVATLKLLRAVATEPEMGAFLLLGGYRSEEVGPQHPVSHMIDALGEAGIRVDRLELGPLDSPAITALLCDALRVDAARARALAEVVWKKTGGNPFFVRRFLSFLYRSRFLVHDAASDVWTWDLKRAEVTDVTANVVDLLAATIRTLPAPSQRTLEAAACIGGHFELELLARVRGEPLNDVAAALNRPLAEGLIVGVSEGPRFTWMPKPVELGTALAPAYRFVHDRIQQAAYELAGAEQRKEIHLAVGHALLEMVPPAMLDAAVCPIVDQLNWAADRVSPAQRCWLAELNHRAGRRARSSTAYASALGYFQRALELLPERAWSAEHNLWFRCQRDAAECATLSGEHALAERMVDEGLAHTDDIMEQAALLRLAVTGQHGARR